MSEKLQLRPLSTLANHESALHVLNDNFNDIANKIDTLLSRDGDIPNHMTAAIDCNHNDILNVGSLEVEFILIEGENLLANYYTIPETNSLLQGYSLTSHGHIWGDISGIPTYVNSPTVCDLIDTNITCGASIDNNYVLAWDAANLYWTPVEQAGASGGISEPPAGGLPYSRTNGFWVELSMEGLSDYQLTGGLAADGEVIGWDSNIGAGGEWTNIGTVVHEVVSPVLDTQYVYKNNAWIPISVQAFNLDKLADVSYDHTAPVESYVLQYTFANNVLGQWEPVNLVDLRDEPTYVAPVGGEPEPVWGRTSLDAGTTWEYGKAQVYNSSLVPHLTRVDNPHVVTAAQVGAEPADATLLRTTDVHDTPVDTATTNPISSNWAYDLINTTGQWDNVTSGINYSAGNVGINDTSPNYPLEVNGRIQANATVGGAIISFKSAGAVASSGFSTYEDESYLLLNKSDGSTGTRLHSADDSYFNGGNVAIGKTIPTTALDVVGTINTDAHGDSAQWNAAEPSKWDDATGGINYASGNVGIGTTTPSEKLEVKGNVKVVGAKVSLEHATGGKGVRLTSGVNNGAIFGFDGTAYNLLRITSSAGATDGISVTTNNRVGIGVLAPSEKLEVDGNISYNRVTSTSDNTRSLEIKGGNGITRFDISCPDVTSAATYVRFLRDTNTTGSKAVLFYNGVNSPQANIGCSDDQLTYFCRYAGKVGIGTSTPSEKLEVDGNIHATGNITATGTCCSSDINLKKNIIPINDASRILYAICGYRFNWKDNDKADMGLIAQELATVAPELVITGKDDIKRINYNGVVAILVEGYNLLDERLKKLEGLI